MSFASSFGRKPRAKSGNGHARWEEEPRDDSRAEYDEGGTYDPPAEYDERVAYDEPAEYDARSEYAPRKAEHTSRPDYDSRYEEAYREAEPAGKRSAQRRSLPPSRLVPEAGGRGWLVAHNLAKSYRGRQVVHDASLAVARGEAVGLLGPNGAGKTTIFYMITGLVKADKGTIELDGHNVTPMPMYRRARLGVGYLPQEASIFRGLSVEANIRAVLEVVEPDKAQREEQLDALLAEFGIGHLRKALAISLSGGERRRCEIARALASRPAFMLLDEPFTGVDPIAVGDIQALVRHLTGLGIGVLITDHNVRETLGLIDRAYIIHSGEVLFEGRPEEIVESPEVRRFYLGEQFSL